MDTIPLSILIEANECLKQARHELPISMYLRTFHVQLDLDAWIQGFLATQQIEVKK